jgi:hypothetical protein
MKTTQFFAGSSGKDAVYGHLSLFSSFNACKGCNIAVLQASSSTIGYFRVHLVFLMVVLYN